MFVITGATGRTGAVAAKILLQGGHDVRVVVRGETAAEAWRGQGADAAIADYHDADALIAAFDGTAGQAVLLGLSAAISHTIIVWALALAALTFGNELIAEDMEP
jgi:uncharacterized protein YbjT (DUF2867 family)